MNDKTVIVGVLLALLTACTIIYVTGDNNQTEQRNQSDMHDSSDDALLDEIFSKKKAKKK